MAFDAPLFAALGSDRLATLAAVSTLSTVDAGEVVAHRGTPATRLIVVETGAFAAVRETADGQRLRLGEFPAPCAIDKAAVLDAGGHTATWMAAVRSQIRLIPAAELFAIIDDVPAARRHVLRILAGQVRDQQDDLAQASFGDAITRTAAWLARAAGRSGSKIILPGGQQGLAESIGMTRVSVNRALRSLTEEGLVHVGPGTVTVLAPELLTLRANGSTAEEQCGLTQVPRVVDPDSA
jgi:CRP/FNR family transcriptional regulator, cyclic AMP receptor protein